MSGRRQPLQPLTFELLAKCPAQRGCERPNQVTRPDRQKTAPGQRQHRYNFTSPQLNQKENIKSKIKLLVVLVLFVITVQPAFAADAPSVQGLWKLVSYEVETQATGKKIW
jgi:hypothetical protein